MWALFGTDALHHQYWEFCWRDKTIIIWSYLRNGDLHVDKTVSFYKIRPHVFISTKLFILFKFILCVVYPVTEWTAGRLYVPCMWDASLQTIHIEKALNQIIRVYVYCEHIKKNKIAVHEIIEMKSQSPLFIYPHKTYFMAYSKAPLSQHGLAWIPTWINNYIRSKVVDDTTYPFPNFNGFRMDK